MNHEKEEYFINTYIRELRRERILFELTNPGKRNKGLDRFCHQASELLDKSKIVLKGDNLENSTEFISFVRKHDEACYVLSPDPYMNERSMLLSEAVSVAAMGCDAAVIIGNTFAVVFSEAMKGGREKYLLSEEKR